MWQVVVIGITVWAKFAQAVLTCFDKTIASVLPAL
jgi:hypothetical protein